MLLTNVHSSGEVQYKPCCWYNQDITVQNKQQLDDIREQLNKVNFWILPCSKCKDLEKNGLPSPRLDLPIKDYVSQDQIALEVQFDRECNAACITCGEWSSTTWMKYNNRIQNISTQKIKTPDVDKNIDKILSLTDLEKVGYISMIGGEPFASDTHLKILKSLPETNLKNITVNYQTNGSIFPNQEILSILDQLKEVIISFSIDGVNEKFNYIRWPLLFDQVDNNVRKFLNLENKNFTFSIAHTLTPLNILYYDQLEKYHIFLQEESGKKIKIYRCSADGVTGLQSTSQSLRNAVIHKYKNQDITKFLNLKPYDQMSYERFISHINFHDQHRNISWKETFSEIANLL
jgi:organic radical activating enzyme